MFYNGNVLFTVAWCAFLVFHLDIWSRSLASNTHTHISFWMQVKKVSCGPQQLGASSICSICCSPYMDCGKLHIYKRPSVFWRQFRSIWVTVTEHKFTSHILIVEKIIIFSFKILHYFLVVHDIKSLQNAFKFWVVLWQNLEVPKQHEYFGERLCEAPQCPSKSEGVCFVSTLKVKALDRDVKWYRVLSFPLLSLRPVHRGSLLVFTPHESS